MKINEYLTRSQAAEYLGVTGNTLVNWEASGKIKSHRNPHNNYRLYKKEDLQKLLDNIKNKNKCPHKCHHFAIGDCNIPKEDWHKYLGKKIEIVGNPDSQGPIRIGLSDRVIFFLKELREMKKVDILRLISIEKEEKINNDIKELDEIIGER